MQSKSDQQLGTKNYSCIWIMYKTASVFLASVSIQGQRILRRLSNCCLNPHKNSARSLASPFLPQKVLCPFVALIRRLCLPKWHTSGCETGPESRLYRWLWYSSPPVFRAVHAAAAQRPSCRRWGGNSPVCSGLNWVLPWFSREGNVTFTRGLLKTESTYSGVPVCFALLG